MTAYDPKYSAKHEAYRKNKYHILSLNIEKAYYNDVLKPAADRAGMAVSAYIKIAIADKIAKDENATRNAIENATDQKRD